MEIRSIIEREQPDLLLGNSCGSFLAQMLAPVVGIPALLGNPYFMMTEFKTWYAPLAQKMLMEFSAKEERYFQHFKGGKYKFIHSAFDSETQERMVVYQALYGEQAYWVRPENMFFGKVTRDGRTFNRFTEIDR